MENNYRLLLEQIDGELYLDGVSFYELTDKIDPSLSNRFLDFLHYKLINDKCDYCEIHKIMRYNQHEPETLFELYVDPEKFEQMKYEIYLFANLSFYLIEPGNMDTKLEFPNVYAALDYSKYLYNNRYHNIKYNTYGNVEIYISKKKVCAMELREQYNEMQKVKRLVK